MSMRLDWGGDAVHERYLRACERAVNETAAACVRQAKQNHPGWQNRTGTAEGAVGIVEPAQREGSRVVAVWGDAEGVEYMPYLEFQHGHFLMNAAAAEYPKLKGRIRAHAK